MPGASIVSRKSEVARRRVTWKLESDRWPACVERSCLNFFYPWCAWSLRYFGGSYAGIGVMGKLKNFTRMKHRFFPKPQRIGHGCWDEGCNFAFKAWVGNVSQTTAVCLLHALMYCKRLGERHVFSLDGWLPMALEDGTIQETIQIIQIFSSHSRLLKK